VKRKSTSFVIFVLIVSPLLQGASCIQSIFDIFKPTIDNLEVTIENISKSINESIGNVNQTMSQAVATLGQQSASWQGTLTSLESDLAQHAKELEAQAARHTKEVEDQVARHVDEQREKTARDVLNLQQQVVRDTRDLIQQVSIVAKDGAQFTQESINCQIDIFNTHARIAVKNLLITYLNKVKYENRSNRPLEPFTPIVCSANPSSINVAKWDPSNSLILSGTDLNLFDTQKPSIVVIRKDQPELAIDNLGSRVTNYRFAVNVSTMISQGALDNAIQLQVRWNGHRVNPNEIPVLACGNFGQPCCAVGNACKTGVTCVNGTCGVCGRLGQGCCNGNVCSEGKCANSVCSACGNIGELCCDGDMCRAGQCWRTVCTVCGGIGQPCCNGTCTSGRCVNGSCTTCGGTAQPCCTTGSACAPGNRCIGDQCTTCGGLNEHCCSSGICNIGQCVNDFCKCGLYTQVCCPNSSCSVGLTCQGNRCLNCRQETRSTTDYFERVVSIDARNKWGFTNVTIPDARVGDQITIVESTGTVCFDDCDSECGSAEAGHGSGESKSCGFNDGRYHRLAIEAGGRRDHAISMRGRTWQNTTNQIGLCPEDDNNSGDNCGVYSVRLRIGRRREWQETVCN